jgi:hypothetical protein
MRNRKIHVPASLFAWPALTLASAVAAIWCWQLPPRPISLRVSAASPDQLRITWNRDSASALLARSAALEIRDGGTVNRLMLTSEELRGGSITYRRESGDVRVRLIVEPGQRWAGLQGVFEAAEFHGAAPALLEASRAIPPAAAHAVAVSPAPVAPTSNPEPQQSADRMEPAHRAAVIPETLLSAARENAAAPVPVAPSLAVAAPVVGQLGLPMPGLVAAPPRPAYSGPHSGRIIWTGSMARRGVVEIEGAHASIGSLAGGLPGVPVAIRVSPAEFSPQGLMVHTSDAAANNRSESASAANGWNATRFRWEPERARELVVLEAPNAANDYKRLVVRNDARSCSVMLVEWSVRSQ